MVCDQSPPVVKSPSGQVRFADHNWKKAENLFKKETKSKKTNQSAQMNLTPCGKQKGKVR